MYLSIIDQNTRLEEQHNHLKEQKEKYEKQISLRDSTIHILTEKIALLKKFRFAKSSEKWTEGDKEQGLLFNEAELIPQSKEKEPEEVETISYKRRRRGRKSIPADVPREEVVYELK